MVSIMSAELVSLPLLHEPKISTAPRTLMVCYWCVNLASLLRRAPQKSCAYSRAHESLTRSRSKVSPQTKLPLNLAIVR